MVRGVSFQLSSVKKFGKTNNMKMNLLQSAAQNAGRQISMGLVIAAAICLHRQAMATPIVVNLGTASDFTILAYSAVTDAGGASTIDGNVGLSPTTGAAIGLTAAQVDGTIYSVNAAGPLGSVNNPALLTTARNDLSAAYTAAFGLTATPLAGADNQLGGKTLIAGVYSIGGATTANLNGTLTLDAQGDPNAVFVIRTSSTLVTASSSSVVLINGAQPCHVYWVVGSSATLGTQTDFLGTILAYASIGLETGATLDGSALAENAAVTLDHNTITEATCNNAVSTPDGGSTVLMLGFGLAGLLALKTFSARVERSHTR
jgi:hypothetical protein